MQCQYSQFVLNIKCHLLHVFMNVSNYSHASSSMSLSVSLTFLLELEKVLL